MKRALVLVVLSAATATVTPVAKAAEADAPLSGTKQELQRLKTDRPGQAGPTAADALKTTTPTLQLSTELPSAERQREKQKKREREAQEKKEAQENWLIDGMARLEKERDEKAKGTSEAASATPSPAMESRPAVDRDDPTFLLRLYDEQKKADDAKTADKPPRTPQPNAFAPFLQGWMAPSPVKDQLLGEMKRASPTAPVSVGGGGSSVTFSTVSVGAARGDTQGGRDSAPQSNPYLPDADGIPLGQTPSGPFVPTADPMTALAPQTSTPPISTPLFHPDPEPAAATRKVLPPPAADDKKYFPQLKKF